MDFNKDESKSWKFIKRHLFNEALGNSCSTINSNLELAMTNSGLEYPTKDSTQKSVKVHSELVKVESSHADSSLESTHPYSIPKFLGVDSKVGVIMIDYVFIQTNGPMPKGQEFIYTSKTICTNGVKFRHLNFGIKEGTIHLIPPLFFQYYYVELFFIDFLLVKGSISKEMVKKMMRRNNL
jgi:hypothetical protein